MKTFTSTNNASNMDVLVAVAAAVRPNALGKSMDGNGAAEKKRVVTLDGTKVTNTFGAAPVTTNPILVLKSFLETKTGNQKWTVLQGVNAETKTTTYYYQLKTDNGVLRITQAQAALLKLFNEYVTKTYRAQRDLASATFEKAVSREAALQNAVVRTHIAQKINSKLDAMIKAMTGEYELVVGDNHELGAQTEDQKISLEGLNFMADFVSCFTELPEEELAFLVKENSNINAKLPCLKDLVGSIPSYNRKKMMNVDTFGECENLVSFLSDREYKSVATRANDALVSKKYVEMMKELNIYCNMFEQLAEIQRTAGVPVRFFETRETTGFFARPASQWNVLTSFAPTATNNAQEVKEAAFALYASAHPADYRVAVRNFEESCEKVTLGSIATNLLAAINSIELPAHGASSTVAFNKANDVYTAIPSEDVSGLVADVKKAREDVVAECRKMGSFGDIFM